MVMETKDFHNKIINKKIKRSNVNVDKINYKPQKLNIDT